MPLRDVAVTVVILGCLPFCLIRPWVGILVWSWIGFMNPHRLCWGFAYSLPFAEMVGVATVIGMIVDREKKSLPWTREVGLLLAFWAFCLFTTFFAYQPADAWDQFEKISKILVVTFISLLLLQDRQKLRWLLCVIAFSIGFYGLKGGIWAVLSGGQNMVLGPPATFISGNTEIGLALNMVLPLFVFLRRDEPRRWLRSLWLAMFIFSIIAILITYSRGAFVGLAVILSLLFLKSRAKLVAMLLILLTIPVALSTLPDKWFGRMDTIQEYEQDKSAVNRLRAWKVSFEMAMDRPFTGYGFRPFTPQIYQKYDPEYGVRSGDAHSIFFQVLAEHGFIGLALYCMLILNTFLTLRRLKRWTRDQHDKEWAHSYSQMVEISLAAYLVSGAFLSMSYFDLFYALVAITVLLQRIVALEAREEVGSALYAFPKPALANLNQESF